MAKRRPRATNHTSQEVEVVELGLPGDLLPVPTMHPYVPGTQEGRGETPKRGVGEGAGQVVVGPRIYLKFTPYTPFRNHTTLQRTDRTGRTSPLGRA